MKRIVIAGGSGFVGNYLSKKLLEKSYEVHIVSRSRHHKKTEGLTFVTYEELDSSIEGSFGVINLAGYNLFDNRWTPDIKEKIVSSRVSTTELIVESIKQSVQKPSVFVSASAVGIYGNRNAEFLREDSSPGNDFLADVCTQWEEAALKATSTRIVIPRIGIVLEKNGGALGKMLTPFKLFVGGPLGDGKQFFPWVHMDDVVNSILDSIENSDFEGVYNCVAPQLITMAQFSSVLGSVLKRPSLFAVPSFALNLLLGEASEALIASQRVVPQKLNDWGYRFQFDDLKKALHQILA